MDYFLINVYKLTKMSDCDSEYTFPSFSGLEPELKKIKKELKNNFKSKNFSDSKYVGIITEDKREQIGTMSYHNGRIYFGEWKDDLRHGRGIEIY